MRKITKRVRRKKKTMTMMKILMKKIKSKKKVSSFTFIRKLLNFNGLFTVRKKISFYFEIFYIIEKNNFHI